MLRSIAHQTLGAGFNALVGFALLVFLGRTLGPDAFARYVALLSAAVVLLIPIAGGNPSLLYREGVGAAEPAVAGSMVGRATAQVLLATVALTLLAGGLGGAAAAAAMACMGTVALAELVSARLRGAGRFGREAAWQAGVRVCSAAAIVACVLWLARTPAAVFLAWSAGVLLALALGGARLLAWPRFGGLRAHLAVALPLVLVDALLAALTKGDVALLAPRLESEGLAAYAVGTRFTDVAILAFAPVANVLMRAFRERLQAGAGYARAWRRAVSLALAVGAGAWAAAALGGKVLVVLLFGEAYRAGGELLPWLALALPFLLANVVLGQAFVAAGQERRLGALLAVGVLIWAAALWLAAPFGVRAVACAAAAAQAALTVALVMALWRRNAAGPSARERGA